MGRDRVDDAENLMHTTDIWDTRTVDLGLLIGRLAFGVLFAAPLRR